LSVAFISDGNDQTKIGLNQVRAGALAVFAILDQFAPFFFAAEFAGG
jgi:hypothetical protein